MLQLWKSRLPVIVIPVLATLRQVSHPNAFATQYLGSVWLRSLELALLVAITVGTGFSQLPFSVTWWLVLLTAFVLETPLILGVATVLSLSVAIGWYGVQMLYPHAIMALWGGPMGENDEKCDVERICWRLWDMCVHAAPAVLLLWWHGPSISGGGISPGTVTMPALLASLPLNVLWLWGLGIGLPSEDSRRWALTSRLWPIGVRLADSNIVYNVHPDLSDAVWRWVYGVHWVACVMWMAALTLQREVLVLNSIFFVAGLAWMPFTSAWWVTFIIAFIAGDSMPLFRGMSWSAAAPVAMGWYGAQFCYPYIFESLVKAWAVRPIERWAPLWFSKRWLAASTSKGFAVGARLGDTMLHLLPTMTALYLFRSNVTADAALAAIPGNIVYWVAFAMTSGACRLSETNRIYGIDRNLPDSAWSAIFGVHPLFCAVVYGSCRLQSVLL